MVKFVFFNFFGPGNPASPSFELYPPPADFGRVARSKNLQAKFGHFQFKKGQIYSILFNIQKGQKMIKWINHSI
jgi:hypothetical protein